MDGASNMSSDTKGADAVRRQDAPMTLYFHCIMHCFNLCASQSVKVAAIRNCIDVVREIIGFFSVSAPRNHVLQETIRNMTGESARLKKLCDTRFTKKHCSVFVILKLLPALQATFEHLSTSALQDSRLPAEHLLSSLEKFEF